MEMNTRIQVEHPVTEAVTGIDLVKWQIRIAAGEPLNIAQDEVLWNGHSIECRVTAQNPSKGFAPSAGKMSSFIMPGGLGIRVDSQCYSGYTVPPYYDSNLAKLIVWAPSRNEAIIRMECALSEVTVEGLPTNVSFLKSILEDDRYRTNAISTKFLPTLMDELGL
jgi:acetyl-CoA carboxylase biotin carboxylase subunit